MCCRHDDGAKHTITNSLPYALAERVGFEPTGRGQPAHTLSRRAPPATPTPCNSSGITPPSEAGKIKKACVLENGGVLRCSVRCSTRPRSRRPERITCSVARLTGKRSERWSSTSSLPGVSLNTSMAKIDKDIFKDADEIFKYMLGF